VRIPLGPYPGHRLRPHQLAQNVLFWCSIGHHSYDKIADHTGGSIRAGADRRPGAECHRPVAPAL